MALALAAGCSDDTANHGANGAEDGGGGSGTSAGSTSTTAGGTTTGNGTNGASNGTASNGGPSSALSVAQQFGRDHFLIGMGNDLANDHNMDGAYTLGVTLDLHYAYLVGLMGMGGWTDWNPDGRFVSLLADTADAHGVVPMFTLYSMAAWGEANADAANDAAYMQAYWDGAKLLFERLGQFDKPAVVHFEPDWWAYTQQHAADPSAMPVRVAAQAADCADQPDTMVGMGHCLVTLARTYAPKTLIGFHASSWAADNPQAVATYLRAIGAGEADLIFTDMLDRDAGCFEAGTDPGCQRREGGWYWDETNQTSPNFHEHLAWAKAIVEGVERPMMWWQVPFGVPSETPGGTSGHYRDNRVKYIFDHVDEFIEAGGVGACFGTGAANQTTWETDDGQFRDAVNDYFAAPVAL